MPKQSKQEALMEMASFCRRVKWQFIYKLDRLSIEAWILVFIGLLFICVFGLLWQIQTTEDGSRIDLSPARQKQLIEDYKREKEWQGKVDERERVLTNVQQRQDDAEFDELTDKELRNQHVKQHNDLTNVKRKWIDAIDKEDTDDDTINDKNNDKDSRVKSKDKNKINGAKPVGKAGNEWLQGNAENMIRFFDPVLDKIVYKHPIKDSPLRGGSAHCVPYDLHGNLTEEFDCITLSIKPITPICLYPDQEDVHISKHLREEGIWEPHIVKEFQNILYGDPDLAVIDIGANIGEYSLLAAVMGHQVIAVEPYLNNLKRLQKAAQLAKVEDKVTAIQNAVSDQREILYLRLWRNNQGGGNVQLKNPDPDCIDEKCRPPKVWSIFMDDILEVVNFEKAILKIDIEGHEHRAFVNCSRLLDHVYVPYIFMEWLKLRSYYGSEITESEDKDLTHYLVRTLITKGYTPYSSVTMTKLNTNFWYAWPDDIVWKHELLEFH